MKSSTTPSFGIRSTIFPKQKTEESEEPEESEEVLVESSETKPKPNTKTERGMAIKQTLSKLEDM